MKEHTIKTTLHYYSFNTHNLTEHEAYLALCKKLRGIGLQLFDSISSDHWNFYNNKIKPLDGTIVHLETQWLFDNQWACSEGLRIFDWSEAIYCDNRRLKQGMWLEQTQEMIDIRNNTRKCGYCGAQSTGPEEFHTACLGSQYLKQGEIYLIRMRAVSERPRQFPKLTEAEAAVLVPAYEVAQGLGAEEREKKAHSRLRKKVAALVSEAQVKASALIFEAEKKTTAYTWLLDHKFRELDNVIYYSHTDKFCFGWREPYGADASVLRESLEGFPFDYEVK